MKNKYCILPLFALASLSALGADKVINSGGTLTWSEIVGNYTTGDVIDVKNNTIITVDETSFDKIQFKSTDNSGVLNLTKSDTFTNFATANGGGGKLLKVNLQASDTGKVSFDYTPDTYAPGASIPFERFNYDMGGNEVTFNAKGYTFGAGSGSSLDKYSKLTINAKNYSVNTTSFNADSDLIINTDETGGSTQLGGTARFNGDTIVNTKTLKLTNILVLTKTVSGTTTVTWNFDSLSSSAEAKIMSRSANQINLVVNGAMDLSGEKQKVFLNSKMSLTLNKSSTLNVLDLTNNVDDSGLYYATNNTTGVRTNKSQTTAVTTQLTVGSGADVLIKTLGMYNTDSVLKVDFIDATGSLAIDSFDIIADGYDDTIAGTGDISISIIGDVIANQLKIKDGIKVGDVTVTADNFGSFFTSADGKTLYFNAGEGGYNFISTVAVPEPSQWAAIFGAIALAFVAYRRRK